MFIPLAQDREDTAKPSILINSSQGFDSISHIPRYHLITQVIPCIESN